ncbi:MAG: AAA family ATPase [Planctomycetes bacterium]|nr:AAA family ATPase [Planctomycetota bacterium]
MIITSLGIINYKSFDDQGIIIDNLGKTNLFIGKNNSGKSNILTFLKLLSQNIKDLKKMPLQTIENQYRRSAETAKLKLIVSVANLSRYYGMYFFRSQRK